MSPVFLYIFVFFEIFVFFRLFWLIEKIFFEEVEKKSGHQYRSKISLRIEWEHSQRLKTTLKYSSDRKATLPKMSTRSRHPPMMTIFPPFEPSPVNLDATTMFPLEMAMVPQWWFGYKSRGASMYSRFCVSKIRGPLTIYNHLIHRRVCIYYQSARSPCFCFAVNLLH